MKDKSEREYEGTLKPCPFCGLKDISVRLKKTAIIECNNCKALVIKRTIFEAKEAWNKRPEVENE